MTKTRGGETKCTQCCGSSVDDNISDRGIVHSFKHDCWAGRDLLAPDFFLLHLHGATGRLTFASHGVSEPQHVLQLGRITEKGDLAGFQVATVTVKVHGEEFSILFVITVETDADDMVSKAAAASHGEESCC